MKYTHLIDSLRLGIHVGTIISFSTSGWLGSEYGGWPAVFYFSGSLAALWVLLWTLVGAESPSQCRLVSAAEKAYIEKELSETSSLPVSKINNLLTI